jgi:hypothetical protein
MNDKARLFFVSSIFAAGTWLSASGWSGTQHDGQTIASENASNSDSPKSSAPDTVSEARGRAQLLHEMIHGSLQVMHRDFFREDEGLKIPSRSLDDVFLVLADKHQVKVRWLAVNAEPMNVDHKPQDDFENNAVKALATGKPEFDAVEGETFRFAGLIRLPSQCLKCHVPRRTSNKDRAAAVAITMPLNLKK